MVDLGQSQKPMIGLVGAGVMGSNLAARIHENGFKVVLFERDEQLRELAIGSQPADVKVHDQLIDLVRSLPCPRCLLILIKAGSPVDALQQQLMPLLDPGDVIIDLGNSHYADTERRQNLANESGMHFIGCGISGGAEGARNGPALMPGGNIEAWPLVRDVMLQIAATFDNQPCAQWIGPGGSGHFVKMIHNGIEYADMQLIAETYHLMRVSMGLSCQEIGDHFEQWNQGPLQSYLIEITARILRSSDDDGIPLVDLILDQAGQKGTGSWSTAAALEYGIPANMLAESVFARMLSSFKKARVRLSATHAPSARADNDLMPEDLEHALMAAKLLAYCQGFDLITAASSEHQWELNCSQIAAGWRAGCIIRGELLQLLMEALSRHQDETLLADDSVANAIASRMTNLRQVSVHGMLQGVPLPVFGAALNYFDAMHSAELPANLIQAQRDYFGAHGFRRVDDDSGELRHFDWSQF